MIRFTLDRDALVCPMENGGDGQQTGQLGRAAAVLWARVIENICHPSVTTGLQVTNQHGEK